MMKNLSGKSEIKSRRITRKIAALRQIHAAIRLFHEDEYESAITLALSAESQLPKAAVPYAYEWLKAPPDKIALFNEVRNWLKHIKLPEAIEITDFDAAFALFRATSKFTAVFDESSPIMDEFADWIRQKGGLFSEQ
jgi:hypothetical protein